MEVMYLACRSIPGEQMLETIGIKTPKKELLGIFYFLFILSVDVMHLLSFFRYKNKKRKQMISHLLPLLLMGHAGIEPAACCTRIP